MMVNHNATKPPNTEVDTGLQKREFHSFNKVSFNPHVLDTRTRALSKVSKVTVGGYGSEEKRDVKPVNNMTQ